MAKNKKKIFLIRILKAVFLLVRPNITLVYSIGEANKVEALNEVELSLSFLIELSEILLFDF